MKFVSSARTILSSFKKRSREMIMSCLNYAIFMVTMDKLNHRFEVGISGDFLPSSVESYLKTELLKVSILFVILS